MKTVREMETDQYLSPTFFIDCDTGSVREKSQEVIGSEIREREKATNIFFFVRDKIKYSLYVPRSLPEDFRASQILSRGEGYCVQKAVLFVALARAADIPARLRFSKIRNHLTPQELLEKRGTNVFAYHGLAELYIEGSWIKATPTYDLDYCKKTGTIPVHFDGTKDALLPPRALDGRPHIEYLKDRGFFKDLPFDELRGASISSKYITS
ncbi:MAG TPA: transglutaminase-like domain-containing protein [Thermodesulfobacteriota bacterium]|nr:transglutaminase-like domain-containing protein [Thermodesulfobacteriota bacterium]